MFVVIGFSIIIIYSIYLLLFRSKKLDKIFGIFAMIGAVIVAIGLFGMLSATIRLTKSDSIVTEQFQVSSYHVINDNNNNIKLVYTYYVDDKPQTSSINLLEFPKVNIKSVNSGVLEIRYHPKNDSIWFPISRYNVSLTLE